MSSLLRSTRALLALLLLLGSLVVGAAPASAAGTGTVNVDVSFQTAGDDQVTVAIGVPGGETVVAPQQTVVAGRLTFTGVPAGTWELRAILGFNTDNKKTAVTKTITVTASGTVTTTAPIDNRRGCLTATIRTFDGSTVPDIGVQTKQPGTFGNNMTYLAGNTGPSVAYGDTDYCGYAGTFLLDVYELGGFTLIGTVAVDAHPGVTTHIEIVLGDPTPPPMDATGNPDAKTMRDLLTGQTVISLWRGSTSGITLSFRPDCGEGTATSVVLQHGGATYPASGPTNGRYTVTLTRAQVKDGAVQLLLTCDGGSPKVQSLGQIVLYDPSGLITDAVSGAPIVGADVLLHEVPGWTPATTLGETGPTICQSNLSKAPGAEWTQPAPVADGIVATLAAEEGRTSPAVDEQKTDDDGRYGWDVSQGCWYVTVEADGYLPLTSPVVGVPTEVTDLDLQLTPIAGRPGAPTDVTATPSVSTALVTWSAPASDGGSAITDYTVIVSPGGSEIPVGSAALGTRIGGLEDGTTYTFRVRATNANGVGAQSTSSSPVRLGFTDVLSGPPEHPFYEEIEWMADAGITGGYPDGTFRPTGVITRQAMAAFLYRYEGSPLGGDPACSVAPFPDVAMAHPFCGEIDWMVDQAYASGYADGGFHPTAAISRQAMAAFLYRLAGSPNGDDPTCTVNAFPDVTTAHAFCGEIDWMVDAGITGGYADGSFKPGAAVSRQAMAAFLQRYDLAFA